jgi:pyruvate/2-oxoglutarate dehydrogenase complex dihydrolipoamide acyltransferase (E2) component
MMARVFEPLTGLSSWRRLAPHVWDRPHDPTVYGVIDVVVDRTLPYLEALSRHAGTRVRLTHLVTKGLASAIRATPEGNAIVSQQRLKGRRDVDVFVQVSTDGGRDLSGTKIACADAKSLTDIARELTERAERVRRRDDPGVERTKNLVDRLPNVLLGWSVRVMEYLLYDLQLDLSRFGIVPDQFGSAMVSNIGTFEGFGMNFALAPLVPISRCPIVVLVGEVRKKPVVEDDRVVVRSVVTLGCTFDHRVLDGSKAIQIAARLRDVVENPERELGAVPREQEVAAG